MRLVNFSLTWTKGFMDTRTILNELRAERVRLNTAIDALTNLETKNHSGRTVTRTARKGSMSAAARKRLSRLLKQRWASGKMGRRKAKAA
jgi:hypothetical protein